jgi:hypothetical protein
MLVNEAIAARAEKQPGKQAKLFIQQPTLGLQEDIATRP